ncbi:MAG: WD40 repeat domain-containing protein [Candidatus Sericytochromatia bacterium]|nr:WD40 repeat domain-containing protein [Candidatus Sericytochromatia bacterium]
MPRLSAAVAIASLAWGVTHQAVLGEAARSLPGKPAMGAQPCHIRHVANALWCVAYSPTAPVVVAGDAAGRARVFELPTLEERPPIGRSYGGIQALAFSHDGKQLATGSFRVVRVWNWATKVQQHALYGHAKGVWGLTYSPDDTELASAGLDSTIRLWRPATGEPVPPPQLRGFGRGWLFHLWMGVMGDAPPTLMGHEEGVVEVAYSPDGRRLASASKDGTIRIWDLASGQVLQVLRANEGPWSGVAFSPSGQLVAGSGEMGRVLIWNATTGALTRTLSGHDDAVTRLAFGRDDSQLASASLDGNVKLWDASKGEVRQSFTRHTQMVLGVAFSPDGKHLASAGQDGQLVVWDTEPQAPCRRSRPR